MNTGTVKNGILFWGFTFILGLYLIPVAILAYLNPFWFRPAMLDWVQYQVQRAGRYRQLKFGKRPTWN